MMRPIPTLFLMLMAHGAVAQTLETAAEVDWSSTPGRPAVLAQEISELYQTLYNSQNLRIRQVNNPQGLDVQTLMRKEGVFIGDGFPWVVENIVCDLNANLCNRPREAISAQQLGNITEHVGGFGVTNARLSRWRNSAKDVVTIPDYVFTAATSLDRVPVQKGWTPAKAELSSATDCTRWKSDCADVVRKYNPSRVPLKFDGFAILPVVSYSTRIPLKSDRDSGVQGDVFSSIVERIGSDTELEPSSFALEDTGQFTEQFNTYWDSTSQNDALLKGLHENLNAIGTLQRHSEIANEPAYHYQKALFDLIHHPFSEGLELSSIFQNPVDVVVMDSRLVDVHCDLPKNLFESAPETPCEEDLGEFIKKRDHAAHVIGLIAAPVNGTGMIGLNPFARMHFREVPFNILGNGENTVYNQAFDEALELKARVVNLSFGMTPEVGNTNFLRSGIFGLSKNALVVASAGNHARELPVLACDVFPACYYDEPNVITVVGISWNLDEKLAIWHAAEGQGSNYSPNFHIAALANDVLTTIDGNQLAWVSGTSIAAPQVSATASLIYSAAEEIYPDKLNDLGVLPPIAVKNRLIYTADIQRGLRTRVFSGLLNVGRAIEIKYSQLDYVENGDLKSIKGHVSKVGSDTVICRMDSGEKTHHSWRSIRRMFKDSSDRYFLIKLAQPDNPESELEKAESICPRLLTQSTMIEVELDTGDTISLQMQQVRNFTSALFPLPPEFTTPG